MHKTFKTAFTLAEVLLTITIIGVIAALTIPTLNGNVNNSQYPALLKDVYSTLQQSFIILKAENGNTIVPVFAGGGVSAMNTFLTKMRYTKNCAGATGCLYTDKFYYLSGTNNGTLEDYAAGHGSAAILSDGAMLNLYYYNDSSCSQSKGTDPKLQNDVCGEFDVDVNGQKGPNTLGIDIYGFWITQNAIVPIGAFNDGYINSCVNTDTGWGCTAKVLQEGAINYSPKPHTN